MESDIRVVAEAWFQQEEHKAVEPFVFTLPLTYVQFDTHNCYVDSTSYKVERHC